MSRELMQQALDALLDSYDHREYPGEHADSPANRAINALRAALAKPAGICGATLAVIGEEHFGNPIPKEWYSAANDLLRRVEPKPAAVPDGWVVVPKVPTDRMLQSFGHEWITNQSHRCYAAMLAAAPQPDPLQELVDQAQQLDMGYGKPVDVEAVREVIAWMRENVNMNDLADQLTRAIGDKTDE